MELRSWIAELVVVAAILGGVAYASPVQRDEPAVPVGIKRVGYQSQVVDDWSVITLRPGPPRGDRQQLVAEIDGRRVLIEAITVRNHPEGLTPFR